MVKRRASISGALLSPAPIRINQSPTRATSPPPRSPAAPRLHKDSGGREEPEISWFSALTTYLGYAVLIVFGHLRDFCGKRTGYSRYFGVNSRPPKGYAPLLQDWENFYTRRLYHRISDCWNRPIAGPPFAGKLPVIIRESTDGNFSFKTTEVVKPCVNLGSYNYLGFADDWDQTCRKDVMAVARSFPVSGCTAYAEGGYTALHAELETCVAEFLGKEAAIIFNMGFATNAFGIPAVGGRGTLLISDSLNHASIVTGARASGASVQVYKHNDYRGLESLLRSSIVNGQERTHRPWRKIIVMVEGIYSMEGEMVDLSAVVSIAKKYHAYVYLDEAHSIGALGKSGRGVCEQKGVNTRDVDIMMGTFTKSFGAMGGYIAGSREFIEHCLANAVFTNPAHIHRYPTLVGFLLDNSMAPVVCQQVLTAFKVLRGDDGTNIGAEKLARLRDNSNYFRSRLMDMGCEVFGDWDSPVIPVMLYNPTKIAAFSRECLKRGIAAVVVGFPATPVVLSRVRFCVSAGHSRADLDYALEKIAEESFIDQ